MAAQERVQKKVSATKTDETVEETEPVVSEGAEKLKSEIDDILDEIDSVLEEDAAAFVQGFVQKGGELARTAWNNIKGGFNAPRIPKLFQV
jgi:prokaryotic ubiquitin-like protein Pup